MAKLFVVRHGFAVKCDTMDKIQARHLASLHTSRRAFAHDNSTAPERAYKSSRMELNGYEEVKLIQSHSE